MLVSNRTVRSIGESLYIALPPDWTRSNRITKGTQLKLFVGEALVVLPGRDYTSDELDVIFSKIAVVAKAVS